MFGDAINGVRWPNLDNEAMTYLADYSWRFPIVSECIFNLWFKGERHCRRIWVSSSIFQKLLKIVATNYDIESRPFGCGCSIGGFLCSAVSFPSDVELILDFDGLPVGHFLGESKLIVSSFPKLISGSPEGDGSAKKTQRDENQKRIGDFEFKPKERRPEFGSLLFSIVGLIMAFFFCVRGLSLRDGGYRFAGVALFCVGVLLAIDSTIGFLLGLDLWRLGRQVL